MIKFITNRLPGEPEILQPVNTETLFIRTLDGNELMQLKPKGSWSHDKLVRFGYQIKATCIHGAEAFLGDCWVDSTEV